MNSASSMYKELVVPPTLNPASINSLTEQLTACEKENVRFVVLLGGETVFCNGLDLGWVTANETGDHTKDMQRFAAFLRKLQRGKFIAIAHIRGNVSGGGMGLVCACDYVIAEETSTYTLPEGLLGIIPGIIISSLLNRLTPQRIKKMVFTGKKYSAVEAREYGVVDEISSDRESSIQNAIRLMRACKPAAIADIKELVADSSFDGEQLSLKGIQLLNDRLKEPEIRQRLKDISDFM